LIKKNKKNPSGTEIEYPMSESMVLALNKSLKIFSEMKLSAEDVFLLGINITDIAVESLIQTGLITESDVSRLFELIMLSKSRGLEEKAMESSILDGLSQKEPKKIATSEPYVVRSRWGRRKDTSNSDSDFN